MANIFGFNINRKICRACLTFNESVRYCKMKKRKRFFTLMTNIEIDSSKRNWLCYQCAHKISCILAFCDRVKKLNEKLHQIVSNLKNGSKLDFSFIEEAKKSVYFHKLSKSRTMTFDNVAARNEPVGDYETAYSTNSRVKAEIVHADGCGDGDRLPSPHACFVANDGMEPDGDDEFEQSITELDTDRTKIEDDCDPIGLPRPAGRRKLQSKKVEDPSDGDDGTLQSDTVRREKVKVITLSIEQQIAEQNRLAHEDAFLKALYKCTVCFKGFSYEETYNGHMETHKESHGAYKCAVCSKYIKYRNTYQSHVLNHSKRYACAACGFTRAWRTLVAEHYDVAHAPRAPALACDLCGRDFLKKTQLRHHLRYVHRECFQLQCDHCEKKFKTPESQRRHTVTQHLRDRPEGRKRFVCPVCGDRFHNSTFLRRHQIKHSTSRDYYCVDCDVYFKSETILKTHLRTSSKHFDPGRLVPCGRCAYKAPGDRELARHVDARHARVTNFRCGQCARAFYARSSLRRHLRETHEGRKRPRLYVCDYCGKTFAIKRIMTCHRNTHTGERPYACNECDSRFAGSGALYTHVKLVHRKLKRDARGRFPTSEENCDAP